MFRLLGRENDIAKAIASGLPFVGYDSDDGCKFDSTEYDSLDAFVNAYPSAEVCGIDITATEVRIYC